MRDGRKNFARQLVDKTLEQVKRLQLEKYHKCTSEEDKVKIELDPRVIFHQAVSNSMPLLQLMPVKRGGVTYQVNSLLQKNYLPNCNNWILIF